MNRPRTGWIAATALAAATCTAGVGQASPARVSRAAAAAAVPACAPPVSGRARILLDRVPSLISAQMTPTRDGGVVLAFASYRGSPEFPGKRFTVLKLDATGCTRWRASLPGGWPLARPVQPDARSIVVGAATPNALGLYTLSATTGRVLRRDLFGALVPTGGIAPTLLADARGDVAAVLAGRAPGRSGGATFRLTRRAGSVRWSRLEIARGGTGAPAAAALADGRMVVGYPRRGRFLVRGGSITGAFGAPSDAGPISRNFRASAVALGRDGTAAAVWESTTYSLPWRLRAAVRPAHGRGVARVAQLGAAQGRPGTLLAGAAPAAQVSADGRVTVGFAAPDDRSMCATATPAGRFARPQVVASAVSGLDSDVPALIFGRPGSAAAVASTLTPDEQTIVSRLVTVGPGCRARASAPLDPAASPPVQLALDARDRIWALGQQAPTVDARRPLLLTIAG
ncbi:MAG: hypothetical protein QOD69_2761 [Solirubrobacteraceae bacterium]|nr:hypothetical protein [Solirubrobacteraceae bacterium]